MFVILGNVSCKIFKRRTIFSTASLHVLIIRSVFCILWNVTLLLLVIGFLQIFLALSVVVMTVNLTIMMLMLMMMLLCLLLLLMLLLLLLLLLLMMVVKAHLLCM